MDMPVSGNNLEMSNAFVPSGGKRNAPRCDEFEFGVEREGHVGAGFITCTECR